MKRSHFPKPVALRILAEFYQYVADEWSSLIIENLGLGWRTLSAEMRIRASRGWTASFRGNYDGPDMWTWPADCTFCHKVMNAGIGSDLSPRSNVASPHLQYAGYAKTQSFCHLQSCNGREKNNKILLPSTPINMSTHAPPEPTDLDRLSTRCSGEKSGSQHVDLHQQEETQPVARLYCPSRVCQHAVQSSWNASSPHRASVLFEESFLAAISKCSLVWNSVYFLISRKGEFGNLSSDSINLLLWIGTIWILVTWL